MLSKESQGLMVGYGSMLMESFVAVMAMIAACVLKPGIYFAVNSPAGVVGALPEKAVATIIELGLSGDGCGHVGPGRESGRGDAFQPHRRRAVAGGGHGAHFFGFAGRARGDGHLVSLRDHVRGAVHSDAYSTPGRASAGSCCRTCWAISGSRWAGRAGIPGIILSSALIVAAWGFFLFQGVLDPLGGINSLWPLFGISNQLLAAIALCVCTTILIKMGKGRFVLITLLPLVWLVSATMTASVQKIWAPEPGAGLPGARALSERASRGGSHRGRQGRGNAEADFQRPAGRHGDLGRSLRWSS